MKLIVTITRWAAFILGLALVTEILKLGMIGIAFAIYTIFGKTAAIIALTIFMVLFIGLVVKLVSFIDKKV